MVNAMEYMQAVDAYGEVMDLVRREALAEHMGEHYEVLARFHMAANNRGSAEKYARLALRELEEYGEAEGEEARNELKEIITSLRSYRVAEKRSRGLKV
jgi:hypothetical protein